ncbi:hypothetical protein ABZY83_33020 [Streptomyces virginiae]|uniref:hypothetical protein n=1 Tax=Streptomyces TaxID=1883 RepID=UPI0006AE68E7|nr:hypothetical protein [Streptomyces sp. H021]KOV31996.1 hypothetical protein ADK97_24125 [Streptomyces sp. H021]
MTRTTLPQRLALLGASGALAAGGALLPTTAFAAPAPSQVTAAQTVHEQPEHTGRNTTTTKTETVTTTRNLPRGETLTTKTKTVTETTRDHHGNKVKVVTTTMVTKTMKNRLGKVIKRTVTVTKRQLVTKPQPNFPASNNDEERTTGYTDGYTAVKKNCQARGHNQSGVQRSAAPSAYDKAWNEGASAAADKYC